MPGILLNLHSSGNRSRGKMKFSLLELMITVAIIAILVALLLPVLNKAREAGFTSNCRGNLRQQIMALLQYAGDNQDSYPALLNAAGDFDPNSGPVAMNPYLGIEQPASEAYFNPNMTGVVKNSTCPYNGSRVFYCPARKNTNAKARYSDYGTRIGWWVPSWLILKISHLKKPSMSLFRVDTTYGVGYDFGRLNIGYMSNVHFRHNSRANTMYFDGHIASSPLSISTGMTFPDFAKIE